MNVPVAPDGMQARSASWFPMLVIAMGQTLTTLNISALPVSIGAMVADFEIAPTTVGTAIMVYSIAVSGFIMLGAKLGQKFGSTTVFRWATAVLLLAAVLTTFSPDMGFFLAAQMISGLGAAMLQPSLVVLIADNYSGAQQAKAIGLLGAVQAAAAAATVLIAGFVGTHLGWRYSFGLIMPFAVLTWYMSRALKPSAKQPELDIDGVGALLAVAAITLISLGFNFSKDWGLIRAAAMAPAAPLGLSPALLMTLAGVVGLQLFGIWMQRRKARQLPPLLAIEVIESRSERTALLALMSIVAIGSALNFMIPLYMQMVQGQSSLDTALALVPYQLAVLTAAILVTGLYRRFSPRQLARYSFMMVSVALLLLAAVVKNQWHDGLVVLALILAGVGQGALVTLLFNVLISASPKHLAGDIGALRGAARNLANGIGAVLAGVLVVGLLSASIEYEIREHPDIPPSLMAQINLDHATFISNVQLKDILAVTTASPPQVSEALRINAEARLYALKLAFLFLAGIALLMIIPVRRLPGFSRSISRGNNVTNRQDA